MRWGLDADQQVALLLGRECGKAHKLGRSGSGNSSVWTTGAVPHPSQETTVDTAGIDIELGGTVAQSIHVVRRVLLDEDLAVGNEHVHTHVDSNPLSQVQGNIDHLLLGALIQFWDIVTNVQVLLDRTSPTSTRDEVNCCTSRVNFNGLHTTRFETTELVQAVPGRIDDCVAWTVTATIRNDVNGRNLAIDDVEFVLGWKTGSDELLNNNLGGAQKRQFRHNVGIRHCNVGKQINSTTNRSIRIRDQHKDTLTRVEVGSLDNNTIHIRRNIIFQANAQFFGACDATKDLRGSHVMFHRKQIGRNLIFKVVEPVALVCNASRVVAELGSAVLDQGRK